MKIEASYEGVKALRDFAESMPYAVNQIDESTHKLLRTFNSLESELGVRGETFRALVEHCIRATAIASDAVLELPSNLQKTADELEDWLNKQLGIDGVGGTDPNDGTRRGAKTLDTRGATRR